ncbi:LysR family transcriptional regulator [Paraburkholderia nemoris]|uniref:HTH-type transcriptional regulator YhaJ n=1 Tax=Paraburkholderia nemoris TaxID=2793076 RepID=A0ABM8QYH8_9BURK|nr:MULTISPECIES: LysR family transcriptional regulator [Paraburkholderia]MBK3810052.1 LysR family transcriptional regulator [Paraburkholderia aspalathi]CAE6722596.1 HTH-type transcriptional regulator YhaJ [Paraburkholderia nemoris]CAE6750511.1 HTH-type transcriptional regulator YhaJ [Paraburkholderia nemoris]
MLNALTFDQLRILVSVSESGSFSAAGRHLGRVQSAISHTIQTLEFTQGVTLFDRSRKTPRLTEAGAALVTQARRVLRQADVFEDMARSIADGQEAELSIAADSFVPAQPLIESLKALRDAFPSLPLTLYTEGLGAAQRRIRDRTASLALCAMFPTGEPELQAYPLMSMTMIPVVGASHPLAAEKGPLTRDALMLHIQLVLTDPVDSRGPSYSIVSSNIWRFVEQSRRLDFILAGFGWANMPTHLVAPFIADGRLVALEIDDVGITPPAIQIFAVHDRSSPPRKVGLWLLDHLLERFSARSNPA